MGHLYKWIIMDIGGGLSIAQFEYPRVTLPFPPPLWLYQSWLRAALSVATCHMNEELSPWQSAYQTTLRLIDSKPPKNPRTSVKFRDCSSGTADSLYFNSKI